MIEEGAALPRKRHNGFERDAQLSGLLFSDINLSIPPNAISEISILDGVNCYNKKITLRKYHFAVRDGKMRRIVVAGTPYYVPIEGVT